MLKGVTSITSTLKYFLDPKAAEIFTKKKKLSSINSLYKLCQFEMMSGKAINFENSCLPVHSTSKLKKINWENTNLMDGKG
jgi:hypothetical protein